MRTTIAAAAMALTSSAVAFAEGGERRFTHDGQTYVYTSAVEKGRQVITGRQLPSRDAFRLVVDGGWVKGRSAGQPVAFRTASTRGAAGGVAVASN